jgi:hypothetical protein
VTVQATDSIYQVFGASGSTLNDATNAELITFAAGPSNLFTFSASGSISNCCTQRGPDGLLGSSTTAIIGINGLSSVVGNSALPLLGVFLSETSPVGSTAPDWLTYDANAPTALSPGLGQIFYIGDGRASLGNVSGEPLTYTAPSTATRLYLGVADGYENQPPTMYSDNSGSFAVHVTRQ